MLVETECSECREAIHYPLLCWVQRIWFILWIRLTKLEVLVYHYYFGRNFFHIFEKTETTWNDEPPVLQWWQLPSRKPGKHSSLRFSQCGNFTSCRHWFGFPISIMSLSCNLQLEKSPVKHTVKQLNSQKIAGVMVLYPPPQLQKAHALAATPDNARRRYDHLRQYSSSMAVSMWASRWHAEKMWNRRNVVNPRNWKWRSWHKTQLYLSCQRPTAGEWLKTERTASIVDV